MAISSKRIHVLIIPSWYPQSPSDIGGSFFREQALALKKRGLYVGVISPCMRSLRDPENFSKPFGLRRENDEGMPTLRYHFINFTPRMELISEKIWVMWGMKLFLEYKRKYGLPDIIHVHSLDKAAFLAFRILKRFNIPYIITEHSSIFARDLISLDKKKRLHKVVMAAEVRFAVSQPFTQLLNNVFHNSSWEYIPNVVSDDFLKPSIEVKANKEIYSFINVCFLTKNKKVDNLIKAFCLLTKKYQNLRLKIGGDGICRQGLEALALELNIFDKIEFLGKLTRDEVFTHIQQADAFVLSSEYETFGVVLIEALALGKPVVATRCGGPESIVKDEVGVLVEKNSVQALCDGMELIYKKRASFNARDIQSYCRDNFSEDAVTSKLSTRYRDILQLRSHE